MNKNRIIIILLVMLFCMPVKVWAWAYIYDSENELLYVGGYDYFKIVRDYDRAKQDNYSYLKNSIYEVNIKKNTKREIFKTDKSIYGFKLSEKGYLAVSACRNEKCDLLMLNREGDRVKEFQKIPATLYNKFYHWSPDGTKITYLISTVNQNRPHLVYKADAWIFNIETGENYKIKKECMDISWEEFDGNLYLRRNELETDIIYMFNPMMKKGQYTKRKGMWFTTDGAYYIGTKAVQGLEMMEENYFIYKSSDNSIYYALSKNGNGGKGTLSNWLGFGSFIKNTHKYLMWSAQGRYKMFDIDAKQIIRNEAKKRLIGWNKDMTKVVVYEGGDKIHIDELLTGKRLKSIEIPK